MRVKKKEKERKGNTHARWTDDTDDDDEDDERQTDTQAREAAKIKGGGRKW